MSDPLLRVRKLGVELRGEVPIPLLRGIDLELREGEALGVVGSSGAGKTLLTLAIPGLLPGRMMRVDPESSIRFRGEEIAGGAETLLRSLRGARIGMVFQEPMTALNPLLTIGTQVAEPLRHHRGMGKTEAEGHAAELLDEVGIPDPERWLAAYPHQLSGGMRQRAMIASAIACGPSLLIADEPTSALDPLVRARILSLLARLRVTRRMALLLVSHDLESVARICDRIAVLEGGAVVESGTTANLLGAPGVPATRRLVAALSPPLETVFAERRARLSSGGGSPTSGGRVARRHPGEAGGERAGLLEVEGLRITFRAPTRGPSLRASRVVAIDGVSFRLDRGEALGILGPSGAGKSTLARAILRLEEAEAGSIRFEGAEVGRMGNRELRRFRKRAQIVFQDPYGTLHPRKRIGKAVEEVLLVHGEGNGAARRERAAELLSLVGLEGGHLDRLPHELSGGERQRAGIARALAVGPELLILDEPVSALDPPIRRQILDLLLELGDRFGLSYLLISHDPYPLARMTDRILVLDGGRVLEEGRTADLLLDPRTPVARRWVTEAFRLRAGGTGGEKGPEAGAPESGET